MAELTPNQVEALPASSLVKVSPQQFGAITTEAIGAMSNAQIAALPTPAFKGMKLDQAGALSAEQIAAMSKQDIAAMPAAVKKIVEETAKTG
jgi:hypothetical protein